MNGQNPEPDGSLLNPIVENLWIPKPAPAGHRHNQMMKLAVRLIGNGMCPAAVSTQLRSMFPSEGESPVPDQEIENIVNAVAGYDLKPLRATVPTRAATKACTPAIAPAQVLEDFLGGFRCVEGEILAKSPVKFRQDAISQAGWFLRHMFDREDLINLVWNFRRAADGKVGPDGYGKTHSRSYWLGKVIAKTRAVPQSDAGAWIRINPLDGKGIGNKNVAAFRYCLVEFDAVPVDIQLAFFAKVKLPIAAMVTSGGKSIHAWVKVGVADAASYKEKVGTIFNGLAMFGIDQGNKNPSRLARLPGAVRKIGGVGDGAQRLLYLNSNPDPVGISLEDHHA